MKHSNDNGAAAIFGFVLIFLLSGLIFLCVGYGVDKLTMVAASQYTGIESNLKVTTFNYMLLVFRAMPIITLITIGISYWVACLRTENSVSEIGTMIVASVEMISLSFVLMAFELYGGLAIDSMAQFASTFPVTNPDLSLYQAAQYIGPVFYGLIFIIMISLVVNFVMTAVRVVDFSNYNYRGYG